MVKKVLLVTLFDENNIGNRLQNFALQHVIMNYGIEVTTLDNFYTTIPSMKNRIKYFVKKIWGCVGSRKYMKQYQEYVFREQRRELNKKFDKINLSIIRKVRNKQSLNMDWSYYDMAIAGSDQVWHKWRADSNELPFYYLQFMPFEKRAAYAASFGFEAFPEQDIEQHRVGLSGMKYISCREETGCSLVKELIGKDVSRVLDPTLLLKAEEWRKIEEQANHFSKSQGNYAFAYFLGELSDEYKMYINDVMQEKGIDRLIDFFDFNDKDICESGPSEFLRLIDRAKYVFTDSFHCTVFSIIFEQDFTVFRRIQPGFEKMFDRIEDLLASTDKLKHIYGGTSQEPRNDFHELYVYSVHYIENILGLENED